MQTKWTYILTVTLWLTDLATKWTFCCARWLACLRYIVQGFLFTYSISWVVFPPSWFQLFCCGLKKLDTASTMHWFPCIAAAEVEKSEESDALNEGAVCLLVVLGIVCCYVVRATHCTKWSVAVCPFVVLSAKCCYVVRASHCTKWSVAVCPFVALSVVCCYVVWASHCTKWSVAVCPFVVLSAKCCYVVQAEERHDSTEERLIQLEQNLGDKEVELQRVSWVSTLCSV